MRYNTGDFPKLMPPHWPSRCQPEVQGQLGQGESRLAYVQESSSLLRRHSNPTIIPFKPDNNLPVPNAAGVLFPLNAALSTQVLKSSTPDWNRPIGRGRLPARPAVGGRNIGVACCRPTSQQPATALLIGGPARWRICCMSLKDQYRMLRPAQSILDHPMIDVRHRRPSRAAIPCSLT